MNEFAALLDALAHEPEPEFRRRLLARYFASTADPDRGAALALFRRETVMPKIKRSMPRELIGMRLDSHLFDLGQAFVGDIAETVALAWPESARLHNNPPSPRLHTVIELLRDAKGADIRKTFESLLDELDAAGRYHLFRLATSGLRANIATRDLQVALAMLGSARLEAIVEAWSEATPPYTQLFALAEGHATAKATCAQPAFRSMARARPVAEADLSGLNPSDWIAEWAWQGRRAQALVIHRGTGERVARLYSVNGEDIGAEFPDVVETLRGSLPAGVALDGVIVARGESINEPSMFRVFDLVHDSGADTRALPLTNRRRRLAQIFATIGTPALELSTPLTLPTLAEMNAARRNPHPQATGVIFKPASSAYAAGVSSGWLMWRHEPHRAIAALMYARREPGRRPPFDALVTPGLWRNDALVPVGEATIDLSGEERLRLDRWMSEAVIARYGPTREFARARDEGLAVEIEFDRVERAPRRKAGVALVDARIIRVMWDAPAGAADSTELLAQIAPAPQKTQLP